MSYKEKSIGLSLLITLYLIYSYYAGMTGLMNAELFNEQSYKALLMKTTTWVVTLAIVAHIIIAIFHAKEAEQADDERDKLIEMKASQHAYYILVVGITLTIVQVQLGDFFDLGLKLENLSIAYNIMHYVIISFLIAETTRYAFQLFYYRRGC
ncbi:MAG: DUF2178 domain-containing protein [Thalassotalea sp.]